MIKTSIEKLAKGIGFDIGMSDDVVQSDLLNGFCKGLANNLGTSSQKIETQICYIADKLEPKTHEVIKHLYEFIKLKESEK